MSQLKTVKDLNLYVACVDARTKEPVLLLSDREDQGDRAIYPEELKQMNIDWIKELRENMDNNLPFDCKDTIGLILWIKRVYNITDKDLEE